MYLSCIWLLNVRWYLGKTSIVGGGGGGGGVNPSLYLNYAMVFCKMYIPSIQ